jgi:MFS family permease
VAVAAAQTRRTIGAIGVAVLCVSQFVDVLSVNTAVIALPDIRADLGMGAAAAQWVISVYALLFGSLLLFAGRLVDRVGRRRMFAIGLGTFGVGSALCALSQSGAMLVAGRAATGAAAALTVPAALALLVSGTEEARRPRALGWWTAAGAAGTVAVSRSAASSRTSRDGARRSRCPPSSRSAAFCWWDRSVRHASRPSSVRSM